MKEAEIILVGDSKTLQLFGSEIEGKWPTY
jgi:hypothetical protein